MGDALTRRQWLALPVTLDALPSSALVVFTVWDCGAHGEPVAVGGTTVPIFRADAPLAKMVKGRKRLYLWPRREGSGADAVTTPWDAAQLDESDRLERCVARYDKHKVDRVAWLDPYAFAEIRRLQDEMLARRRMDVAFVTVEFPSYRHAVVFHERQYVSHPDESDRNEIVTVFDPELSQSNPVDEKFQRMRRYQIGLEAMAKPTNQEKKELARIIGSPPTKQLTCASPRMRSHALLADVGRVRARAQRGGEEQHLDVSLVPQGLRGGAAQVSSQRRLEHRSACG